MYLSGKKIAYSVTKESPGFFEGKSVTDTYSVSRTRFKHFGTLMNQIESTTTYTDDKGNKIFERITAKNSDGTFAKTEIRYLPGKIDFKTETKDGKTEKVLDIPKDLPFDISPIDLFCADPDDKEHVYEYYSFNAETVEIIKNKDTVKYAGDEEITVCGKKYDCAVIESRDKNNLLTKNYISGGEVLKVDMVDESMVAVKDTADAAKNFDEYDIMEDSKISTNLEVEDPEAVVSLKGKIIYSTGKEEPFNIKSVIFDPEKSLPYPIKAQEEYLKATTVIDCGNPEIIAFAKKAAEGAKNSYEACDKLKSAVYDLMDFTESGVELQKASDILKNKKGVCRHASLLYTALVRSLGIPCRQIYGVAYIADSKEFGGHAWAECYVGQWVPFDPTWNSDFVDATHIPVAEYEKGDFMTIFGMEIEVEEAEVSEDEE